MRKLINLKQKLLNTRVHRYGPLLSFFNNFKEKIKNWNADVCPNQIWKTNI